ncbi:MAG TPA: RIO1 family regulatory kinase/ATPase [Candidatus Nanoarchaeia archaeon]|nr:RIO1 family regulatory kinase/ATPase [Candidatus Nanoarchaeia archaeon]
MSRPAREKFKTYKNVFDNHAERILFKLASEGHFEELTSPVALGKEANIFTAKKGDSSVIVKIYRLETCDFNRMYDFIKLDPRYAGLHKRSRRIIFAWCQREYRNLLKAREAGIRVPMPITFKDNVLVMEQIGLPSPAAKAKDVMPEDVASFAEELIDAMKKYHKAGMVHGDLSEFNILNDDGRPVLIDFSQSLPYSSPRGREMLERDVRNVSRFLTKKGYPIDTEKLMADILGKKK